MKLGNIAEKAGLSKRNLMEAAKLGAGAAAFPFVYGLIQSKALLRLSPKFAQNTPAEYVTRALSGVILGALTNRLLKQPALGDGMAAAAVGSTIKDIIAPMLNPSAAAAQAAITATEQATGESQMSGTNPLGRGLAGFGAGLRGLGQTEDRALLFGVGTPDMSGAAMFSGATVAIEDTTSGLSGATVAIEEPTNFAASFTG
jgi:hypothetical protein